MEGLIFSSDVEVGATPMEDTGKIREIVPPAYFQQVLEVETLGLVGGDKNKPIFINSSRGLWFADGALFEVAYRPAYTPEALFKQVKKSLAELTLWLQDYGYEVYLAPVGAFELDKYKDFKDIQQACIAGCNPDQNALIRDYSPTVVDISNWKYRGMGGHIHMSVPIDTWGNALHTKQRSVLRAMVIFAGCAALFVSNDLEAEKIRLEKFGHPGSYRTPTYPGGIPGFEYRAPSSSWLQSQESVSLIHKAVNRALDMALKPENANELSDLFDFTLQPAVDAIKEQDQTLAEHILKQVDII